MAKITAIEPRVDELKQLLLDMAQERAVDSVLSLIVSRLNSQENIALARIWLIGPGDLCDDCRLRESCPDQSRCLHLVASAGTSKSGEQWNRLNGDFKRFPIGEYKIGKIALSGEPFIVNDIADHPEVLVRPEWAIKEGIQAFGGQPLKHQGKTLGVLAVFTRAVFDDEFLSWMRTLADHAAAAIANARAFEEIAELKNQLELERDYLRDEVLEAHAFGEIVGHSPSLKNVIQQIDLVASTDASVLILGDSGTGKELVAREIHRRSLRKDKPMVKCNCASIPRELYESEFFGHVKGAYTGAVADRAGRFQLADGGTLFLDEVGEIPLEMQSKLLRVLQEGELERVGEEKTRQVDVRIIAATNRDLKKEITEKRFREDLYYRLNVFPIEVAPLHDRKEDIALLARHFVSLSSKKLNRPLPKLTQGNIVELQRHDWPGNIRELQNLIERAVITSTRGRLQFDLPSASTANAVSDPVSENDASEKLEGGESAILTEDDINRRDRENIRAALKRANWRISGDGGAAQLLGIKPTTLKSRMKRFGIERPA